MENLSRIKTAIESTPSLDLYNTERICEIATFAYNLYGKVDRTSVSVSVGENHINLDDFIVVSILNITLFTYLTERNLSVSAYDLELLVQDISETYNIVLDWEEMGSQLKISWWDAANEGKLTSFKKALKYFNR